MMTLFLDYKLLKAKNYLHGFPHLIRIFYHYLLCDEERKEGKQKKWVVWGKKGEKHRRRRKRRKRDVV
jgi:hypothetical protein